jgi:hypothetical protein
MKEVNFSKVHYIHVWNYHNDIINVCCIDVLLMYENSIIKLKRKNNRRGEFDLGNYIHI